jgi:DNA polymerase I
MRGDDNSVLSSLQAVAGTRYNRAEFNKDILDNYLLHQARQQGIRLPTGGKPDEFKYLGAFVETTTAGMNPNVVYCDLASLYPFNLLTLNASPETIIGTEQDLQESQYSRDDCVWGYIDPRPVKHLSKNHGNWRQYTDGTYKIVYDPHAPDIKWTCDEADGPQYERLYFLAHDVQEGFLPSCVADLIALKEKYRGTPLYGATKRVVNCFTSDTEVMTPDGVVNIRDLSVGDEVYSVNSETMEVEVKPVVDTWSYPDYNGDLVKMENTRVDFEVTPNHRMLVKNVNPHASDEEFEFVEAGELQTGTKYELPNDWTFEHGEDVETVDVTEWLDGGEYQVFVDSSVHGHTFASELGWYPDRRNMSKCSSGYIIDGEDFEKNREVIEAHSEEIYVHYELGQKWVPKDYEGDDFLELLAWYVTEGSVYESFEKDYDVNGRDVTRGITHTITIQQEDTGDGHCKRIANLLDDMNIDYYDGDRSFQFTSEVLADVLTELGGDGSYEKQLPEFVFNLSKRQKQLVFDTLVAGDGDRDGGVRYSTGSEDLRDDMCRLCVHLGLNPRVRRDSGVYRVLCSSTKNSVDMNRDGCRVQADDGVYCVTVADNHTLLAGRNGNFQFCGNSVYGIVGYSTQDNSSRVFDWRLAEAITLSGRKIITRSRDYILDELHDRGYTEAYACSGDTDATAVSVPSAATKDETLRVVTDIVEQLNDEGYDEIIPELFGVDVDDYRTEIEVESYAPQLFIPSKNPPHDPVGVKKRYIQWLTWDEDDGNCDSISLTGLEAERSDTAPVVTEAQELFAETLRMDDSEARTWLFPRLRELAEPIRNGESDLARVCKRGGIGQDLSEYGTAHRRPQPIYRGAKYATKHIDGVTIQRGDKPAVIYIEDVQNSRGESCDRNDSSSKNREVRGSYPSRYDSETAEDGDPVDTVSLPDPSKLPEEFVVDWEAHWKVLKAAMQPLLDTQFGQDTWSEILHGYEQERLESFAVGD